MKIKKIQLLPFANLNIENLISQIQTVQYSGALKITKIFFKILISAKNYHYLGQEKNPGRYCVDSYCM